MVTDRSRILHDSERYCSVGIIMYIFVEKFCPFLHAMKVHEEKWGTAPPIYDIANRGGEWSVKHPE